MPEIVNCPKCERKLRVPENLLGKKVKCPSCGTQFIATAGDAEPEAAPPPRAPKEAPPPAAPKKEPDMYQFETAPEPPPEQRPRRRRPEPDEEEEEEPVRARRRRPEPEAEDDDEPEEDNDDRPRRRRRRGGGAPHRGTLILVLGILSLVICGFLGPFAWVMGNNDLREIRAGRMDPTGEGITNAGRICGMIATILMLVACVGYGLMIAVVGVGGLAGGRF